MAIHLYFEQLKEKKNNLKKAHWLGKKCENEIRDKMSLKMKYEINRVNLIFKLRRLIMIKCINITKLKGLNMKSIFYWKLVYSLKLFELINIYFRIKFRVS